jgi:hypothetical protein
MEELVKEKDKQLEKFNIYSRCDVSLTTVEYAVLL